MRCWAVLLLGVPVYHSHGANDVHSCEADAKSNVDAKYQQCDPSSRPCTLPVDGLVLADAADGKPLVPLFHASASNDERLLILFAHIPKTGGTTFAHVLSKLCEAAGETTTCTIQQRKELPGFTSNLPWPPGEEDLIGRVHAVHAHFVKLGRNEVMREAGHVNATHVIKVVMARHPVQRMISEYLQTPVPFRQWWIGNKQKVQDTTEKYVGDRENTLVLLTSCFQESMGLLDAVLGFGPEGTASFVASHGGRAFRCFDESNRASGLKLYQAWARRSATDGTVLNGECDGAPVAMHDLATYADEALQAEVHQALRHDIYLYNSLRGTHCRQMAAAGLMSTARQECVAQCRDAAGSKWK